MPDYPISISGCGWVEGSQKRLFVPRLTNKYEQVLYEKVEKESGIRDWRVDQLVSPSQGSNLDSVGQAFEQAIKSAGMYRKINKKISPKVGVIYFNMYGPTTFMKHEFQIKEMYQADVFPAFLLNSHNITGYSVRLRGERNVFFQGLELARTLIQSGELDMVLVGGIFQAFSYLYLTEMLAVMDWLDAQKIKVDQSTSAYSLRESAGFVVVEATDSTEKRQAESKVDIRQISTRNVIHPNGFDDLSDTFEGIADTEKIDRCYVGLHGRNELAVLEQRSLASTCHEAEFINTYQEWGDFANMNPIKVIHEYIQTKSDQHSLLHSIDRDGSAWRLLFTNNHKI